MRKPKKVYQGTLEELLSMAPEERVRAVAEDVGSGQDKYAKIPPHDLAEALGVPEPGQPDGSWVFTHYAERQTLEEHADSRGSLSDHIHHLEGQVSEKRMAQLERKFAKHGNGELPGFDFVKAEEREILEQALDEEQLEDNMSNGLCCVAHFTLYSGDAGLSFEGDIEDDGQCLTLRTPYDERDGNFADLDDCATSVD